jgi:hypothetical protein
MAKLTEAEKRKNFERTVGSSENDMGPLPELKPKQYSPKDISSKTPEPTFKSDVDDIVSGVKKVDRKINDALDPVRKVMVKAAGKEEPGILSKYSRLTKFVPEGGAVKKMAKGGSVSSASKRADGIAIKGKTKGKIC